MAAHTSSGSLSWLHLPLLVVLKSITIAACTGSFKQKSYDFWQKSNLKFGLIQTCKLHAVLKQSAKSQTFFIG
jgi:hypothetical protein